MNLVHYQALGYCYLGSQVKNSDLSTPSNRSLTFLLRNNNIQVWKDEITVKPNNRIGVLALM